MQYIKSPLNYTGGKFKLLKDIIPLFPNEINTFVDLFAGGFNVGINTNANKILCNDHISYLINLYEYLESTDIEYVLILIKKQISTFDLSKTNTEGYNNFRDHYNSTKNILDLFILTCFSFNHQIRFNNSHSFNTPFGKDRSCYNPKIESNLIDFCTRLQNKNIEFSNQDFLNIDYENLSPKDLVYCDPPYLITTGSYNDGKRGFKDWSEIEERQLLTTLDNLNDRKIKFALSNVLYHKGLSNDILIEWSKKYNIVYLDKSYSNCNYQFKEKESKTVEVLVTNYDICQNKTNTDEQLCLF